MLENANLASTVRTLQLKAMADAVQGNIDLATKTSTNAAEAAYAQKLQDVSTARNNLLAIYDTLTPGEKKQADDTLTKLNAQDTFLQDEKQKQKDISTIAIDAAQYGAPNTVLTKILNSSDAVAAMKVAADAGYVSKPAAAKSTTTTENTQMASDLAESEQALIYGIPGTPYTAGRGPDGYADPELYLALYQQMVSQYGNAGGVEFMSKYPPQTWINPVNLGKGMFPPEIENALTAGQKTGGTIQ
jgi:hypothetical protein